MSKARNTIQPVVTKGVEEGVGAVVGVAVGIRDGLDESVGRPKATAILMLIGLLGIIWFAWRFQPVKEEPAVANVADVYPTAGLLNPDIEQKAYAAMTRLAEKSAEPQMQSQEVKALVAIEVGWPDDVPVEYRQYFMATASRYDLPPLMLAGIAKYESAWNPKAVSNDGYYSRGLAQFIPSTWKQVVPEYTWNDAFVPEKSIEAMGKYCNILRKQVYKAGDSDADVVFKIVCAYNWGVGNVQKYSADKAPARTRQYAANVLRYAEYID